jgi:hypothetical protein
LFFVSREAAVIGQKGEVDLMAGSVLTILISYDDPECGGAADALVDQVQRECAALSQRLPHTPHVNARALSVVQGGSHRDVLYGTLQDLYNVRAEDVLVIALLKGNNPEEYKKVKDLCSSNKGRPISNHVVTHLGSFSDVGLVVRNFVRAVLDRLARFSQ